MRSAWDRQRAAAIALGGAVGAGTRWAVLVSIEPTGQLPWTLLLLNVGGSILLGVLLAEEWAHPSARLLLHDAGGIGFCGGLTTFSTFAVEVVDLLRDDHLGIAAAYGALSVVLSVAGVLAGAAALRHVRAVTLPLEEEP
ncbi:MAG: FluC/FEX family fluoride channel [Actinomycetota bacterium]